MGKKVVTPKDEATQVQTGSPINGLLPKRILGSKAILHQNQVGMKSIGCDCLFSDDFSIKARKFI